MAENILDYQQMINDILTKKINPQLGTQYTAPEFEQEFRKGLAVEERMKPIVEREAQLRSMLYGTSPKMAQEMPSYLGPTERRALISAREAPLRQELETTGALREYKYGKIEDVIGKMVTGYTAKLQKAKDEYDKQQDELKNLLDLRNFAEEKRQFEETLKVQKYQAETGRISAVTGGTDKVGWSEWAAKLGIVGAPTDVGVVVAMQEAANEKLSEKERETASVKANIFDWMTKQKSGTAVPSREQLLESLIAEHKNLSREEISTELYGLTKEVEKFSVGRTWGKIKGLFK